MSPMKSNSAPNPDEAATSGFSAQSQMGLPEVLQMCCLSRRSGQITFRSGESYGFIYIQQGRVLHALCGTIEGEEAIYAMLALARWRLLARRGHPAAQEDGDVDVGATSFRGRAPCDVGMLQSHRRNDHHHRRAADHPHPGQPAQAHHHPARLPRRRFTNSSRNTPTSAARRATKFPCPIRPFPTGTASSSSAARTSSCAISIPPMAPTSTARSSARRSCAPATPFRSAASS